jgi:hypothetical protein
LLEIGQGNARRFNAILSLLIRDLLIRKLTVLLDEAYDAVSDGVCDFGRPSFAIWSGPPIQYDIGDPSTTGACCEGHVAVSPSKPIDISKVTMDLMLAEFNRAVPGIGNQVRFFVNSTEVTISDLVPGQPYSVFPMRLKRPSETHSVVADAIHPPRVEGPFINIQWNVLDTSHNQLCQPGKTLVPEEISLLQLFKTCVLSIHRIPAVQIMWGDHYRG